MSLGDQFFLRLEEESGGRVVRGAVFCGECGYQLRGLPLMGRCPECGNEYSCRRRSQKGTFAPEDIKFPAFDLAGGVASAAVLIWLLSGLVQQFDFWVLLFALTFGTLAPIFLRQGWRNLQRYSMARRVAERIAEEEE